MRIGISCRRFRLLNMERPISILEGIKSRKISEAFKAASSAFEEVWGKTPIPTRDGGSIPIVSLFKKELGLDTVLMGFGLDSDAIHSPNEHYGIKNFLIGIETIVSFYKHFSASK